MSIPHGLTYLFQHKGSTMFLSFNKRISLLMVLIAISISGCGSDKPTAEVTGKLSFVDGTPLPVGTRIRFDAQQGSSTGTRSFSAVTTQDGSFSLKADVGNYKIALIGPETDKGEFYKMVPMAYFEDRILIADVKLGMAPLDFKVKKKGKK